MKKNFTMFCAAAALTVFMSCGAAYAGEAPSDVFKNTLDEYRRGEYVRCSYALHDIDANGTDELLVRYSYDESPYERLQSVFDSIRSIFKDNSHVPSSATE